MFFGESNHIHNSLTIVFETTAFSLCDPNEIGRVVFLGGFSVAHMLVTRIWASIIQKKEQKNKKEHYLKFV